MVVTQHVDTYSARLKTHFHLIILIVHFESIFQSILFDNIGFIIFIIGMQFSVLIILSKYRRPVKENSVRTREKCNFTKIIIVCISNSNINLMQILQNYCSRIILKKKIIIYDVLNFSYAQEMINSRTENLWLVVVHWILLVINSVTITNPYRIKYIKSL